MKIGIMQPYFFPYIGYFQLIAATDYYIFFDTPQYKIRSWMNRNRIINITKGFTYITVPIVKAPRTTRFKDIKIDNSQEWRKRIMSQLDVYKKRAPHFDAVKNLVELILNDSGDCLSELCINSVIICCDYLGISLKYDVFSKMDIDVSSLWKSDEWSLNITKALGYDSYVNAFGGMSFYDKDKYKTAGIELQFIQSIIEPYDQKVGRFESGLSIIDVMMFNSVEEIKKMLERYKLVK
jgi:hypothetical protein